MEKTRQNNIRSSKDIVNSDDLTATNILDNNIGRINGTVASKNKTKQARKNMSIATVLVMLGLILSRCSGMFRDILVGTKFVKDVYRDSFTLAFTIPDLIYSLLVGGAIQSAITPTMSAWIVRGEEKRGQKAISIFVTFVSLIMIVVCALGILFSRQIYSFYASADKLETVELASSASRWLFPQIFFMMLAAVEIGVLNAYKRFSSTAFGPTIYNIFVLLSILFFAGDSKSQLTLTTCGIMGAAVIYFLFQYIVGRDKIRTLRPTFEFGNSDFKYIVRKAVPILLSASIIQINMIVLQKFANNFEDGSVYALRNASTVWQMPYGVFAVAVGNVMLPSLAELNSIRKFKQSSELLSSSLKRALFLTIPSAFFVAMMNTEVIKAIFCWSPKYTQDAINRAAFLLAGYAIAIIVHTVIFIVNQAFYAIGRTTIPLVAGIVSLISNIIFCKLYMSTGMGMIALTLAYSTTSIITMIFLCVMCTKTKRLKPGKRMPGNIFAFVVKAMLSAIIASFILYLVSKMAPSVSGKIRELMLLGIEGIIFLIVYCGMGAIFKMPEVTFWTNRFFGKFAKKLNRKV